MCLCRCFPHGDGHPSQVCYWLNAGTLVLCCKFNSTHPWNVSFKKTVEKHKTVSSCKRRREEKLLLSQTQLQFNAGIHPPQNSSPFLPPSSIRLGAALPTFLEPEIISADPLSLKMGYWPCIYPSNWNSLPWLHGLLSFKGPQTGGPPAEYSSFPV